MPTSAGSQRISARRVVRKKYKGRYNAAAISTAAASQRCAVPWVSGSELVASVTITSNDKPDISDSACMPISAAARDNGTFSADRPIRRMLAPIAPDRLSVFAMLLATKARRKQSRTCRLSDSQRAIRKSTMPVNATPNTASAATPSAGSVGTSSRARCTSISGNAPICCHSSHAVSARNALGMIQRSRANMLDEVRWAGESLTVCAGLSRRPSSGALPRPPASIKPAHCGIQLRGTP